jgi:hypothetical protein
MTDVIAWPPLGVTAWELTEHFPQSRSVGLIQGRARTSSAQRPRRVATAGVRGIGKDLAGAGYIRMMNRLWAGGPHLTRVTCLPTIWHLAQKGLDLTSLPLSWQHASDDLAWSYDGDDLDWYSGKYLTDGVPVTENGWHGLQVSGFPPSTIIARPSQQVAVRFQGAVETAYAMTVVRSDANGDALIRTDRASAFSVTGVVSIGEPEVITFEAVDVPRAVQGLSGDFIYQWDFREVFEDEYPDGWTLVTPWD